MSDEITNIDNDISTIYFGNEITNIDNDISTIYFGEEPQSSFTKAIDTKLTRPTRTYHKGVFASDTATLIDVARRLFSLEIALRTHGLVGT